MNRNSINKQYISDNFAVLLSTSFIALHMSVYLQIDHMHSRYSKDLGKETKSQKCSENKSVSTYTILSELFQKCVNEVISFHMLYVN